MRTSGREPHDITEMPVSGIMNRSASPPLASYPKSKGPGDINERFAESGVGDASSQTNQLRKSDGVDTSRPSSAGQSYIKNKNQVRKSGSTEQD